MVRNIILCGISILLIGCAAPKFNIVSTTDKFSDPKAPLGYIGESNRLSNKSSKGGIHIDDKGVYLNPFVYKSVQNNQILALGFYINHYNFEPEDGFRPILKIIFLTDKNERVELNPKYKDSDFDVSSWNPISKEFNISYSESYTAYISFKNFMKIANANSIEAKIVGGHRSQTYPKNKIDAIFLKNIKQFLNEKVLQ